MTALICIFLLVTTFVNILVPISGSAIVTPVLASISDPHTAIGLASFFFIFSGIARIFFFRKSIRFDLVKKLLPISSIGAVIGALALVEIPEPVLLGILVIVTLFFIVKKVQKIQGKGTERKLPFGGEAVGLFSGFLQGTGLAGSDLRNNFLYSQGLALVEVHGTTAIVGATNFLLATIIRVSTGQLSIPTLTPILLLFPFVILGTILGRHVAYKIPKKIENIIVFGVMCGALLTLLISMYY